MDTIREFLAGWKTYMAAAATLLTAGVAFGNGAIDAQALGAAIVAAILACTIGAKIDRAAK